MARAASTKTVSRTAKRLASHQPRNRRPHDEAEHQDEIAQVGPTITVMIKASTRPGSAMNRSMSATRTVSTRPRMYPAINPRGTPIAMATIVAPKPMASEARAP